MNCPENKSVRLFLWDTTEGDDLDETAFAEVVLVDGIHLPESICFLAKYPDASDGLRLYVQDPRNAIRYVRVRHNKVVLDAGGTPLDSTVQ